MHSRKNKTDLFTFSVNTFADKLFTKVITKKQVFCASFFSFPAAIPHVTTETNWQQNRVAVS